MNPMARSFVVLASLTLSATAALAEGDGTQTATAETLVVVTPNPPVIVQQGGPGVQPAPMAPAPIAAAPVAPQNEPWENVSHINGQLVEVGERTKYLKKTFKTNLATNPIGWLAGFYGVSLSHAVHTNVAIRGDANVFNDLFGEGTSGTELGASMPLYFKRVYSGPFLEPGLVVRTTRSNPDYCDSYHGSDCASTDTMFGPQVLFGWHWMFDSGLNVAAAFGMAKNMNTETMDEYGYSSEEPLEPAGYFRIGYAWQ